MFLVTSYIPSIEENAKAEHLLVTGLMAHASFTLA